MRDHRQDANCQAEECLRPLLQSCKLRPIAGEFIQRLQINGVSQRVTSVGMRAEKLFEGLPGLGMIAKFVADASWD